MSQFLKSHTRFRRANSPPCITARRGGCVTNQMVAKPPKKTQPGWFSFAIISFGKPPRPRDQRRLRGIFLIARPPLLAVMRGGGFCRRRFPAHSVFLKPFGILAEIRISDLIDFREALLIRDVRWRDNLF